MEDRSGVPCLTSIESLWRQWIYNNDYCSSSGITCQSIWIYVVLRWCFDPVVSSDCIAEFQHVLMSFLVKRMNARRCFLLLPSMLKRSKGHPDTPEVRLNSIVSSSRVATNSLGGRSGINYPRCWGHEKTHYARVGNKKLPKGGVITSQMGDSTEVLWCRKGILSTLMAFQELRSWWYCNQSYLWIRKRLVV